MPNRKLPASDASSWQAYLNAGFEDASRAIVEAGLRVLEFQESASSCKGGSSFTACMQQWFGMSSGTASKWVTIGKRADVLLRHAKKLPSKVDVVYEIATLPDDLLEAKVSAGVINAETDRAVVREIKKAAKGEQSAPKVAPAPAPQPDNTPKRFALMAMKHWQFGADGSPTLKAVPSRLLNYGPGKKLRQCGVDCPHEDAVFYVLGTLQPKGQKFAIHYAVESDIVGWYSSEAAARKASDSATIQNALAAWYDAKEAA